MEWIYLKLCFVIGPIWPRGHPLCVPWKDQKNSPPIPVLSAFLRFRGWRGRVARSWQNPRPLKGPFTGTFLSQLSLLLLAFLLMLGCNWLVSDSVWLHGSLLETQAVVYFYLVPGVLIILWKIILRPHLFLYDLFTGVQSAHCYFHGHLLSTAIQLLKLSISGKRPWRRPSGTAELFAENVRGRNSAESK